MRIEVPVHLVIRLRQRPVQLAVPGDLRLDVGLSHLRGDSAGASDPIEFRLALFLPFLPCLAGVRAQMKIQRVA